MEATYTLLFKPAKIFLVLDGRITATRRLGRCRWEIGHVHPIQCTLYEKPRGWIRILDRYQDRLGAMTDEDARAEGYSSVATYRPDWELINKARWDGDLVLWVVRFCIYNGPAPEKQAQSTLF